MGPTLNWQPGDTDCGKSTEQMEILMVGCAEVAGFHTVEILPDRGVDDKIISLNSEVPFCCPLAKDELSNTKELNTL